IVLHEHLPPSAGWLWKDTKAVLARAERSTTDHLPPRPSDVPCVLIRKSDDLDNTCAKIGRNVAVRYVSIAVLCPQLTEQCLGFLEVGGIKTLGDPAVDRSEQVVGLGALALLLPQAAEAHGRAQLQRSGVLATGHGEGLTKTLLPCHHRFVSVTSLEQQLPFEPIQFRLVAPLPRPVHQRQRLVQQLLPCVALTVLPICLGQKGQGIWPSCY